jgi:photosystem II stability/assembly factor-like uncharacterized protein
LFDKNAAVVMVGDRGIYRWTGPGAAFAPKQGNLQNTQFYTLTLDPNDTNTVYGISQDQFGALKFTGIPQWNYLSSTSETGKILVNPQNSARIYAYNPLDASSFIDRSDDGGASWTAKGTGISTAAAGYGLAYAAENAFAIDANAPSRLLLGTTDVYLTIDSGDTWTDLTNGPLSGTSFVTVVGFSPSQANTFYAGTSDGHFFRTTDGGMTWQNVDAGLPINGFDHVMEMQIDPSNANRVFMVLGNFANDVGDITPEVWMTTNGGTSWTNISGKIPATYQTLSIAADWRFAKPVLYVGTSRGVYSSSNLGGSWAAFGKALPHAVVSDLQFDPKHDVLAAATCGRGVFEIEVPGPATSFAMSAPATATVGTSINDSHRPGRGGQRGDRLQGQSHIRTDGPDRFVARLHVYDCRHGLTRLQGDFRHDRAADDHRHRQSEQEAHGLGYGDGFVRAVSSAARLLMRTTDDRGCVGPLPRAARCGDWPRKELRDVRISPGQHVLGKTIAGRQGVIRVEFRLGRCVLCPHG